MKLFKTTIYSAMDRLGDRILVACDKEFKKDKSYLACSQRIPVIYWCVDTFIFNTANNLHKLMRTHITIRDYFNPHNVIKIRTLNRSWHDSDDKILHAMFQILVDFVEKEKPFERTDYTWNEAVRERKKEIEMLYRWWTVERPISIKLGLYDDISEDVCFRNDDVMLNRLIAIRRHLWV